MYRIILFLLLIALAAAGAAWVADQTGDVVLSWSGWRIETTLPVFALALGVAIVAAMLAWAVLRALWRMPEKIRRSRRERRTARGRHAVTHGLLAIGHGDAAAARAHAEVARRHAAHDPLALLLHAQSAQLDGDREGARAAFRAMAERDDTRLLGLRGLFIEAQRADDPLAAVMIAEEALKTSPASSWASHAVLGFRCAKGDWSGALTILDNNLDSGLIDKPAYRRQRGVLLTARALELEKVDRDLSRDSVMEAVKLAPTLVPAAALASKYQSEAHQVRRSMRIVETAWLAQPHPDLADAYAHVKLGDSARQRLVRLMAEIERTEHGDSGRARAWTLRAVRALHDPVWTADGYVSDRWRPVSPVTGRLDAFQWQTPLAALPSDKNEAIESSAFEEAMLAPRRVEPPREQPVEEAAPLAAQDNSPTNSPPPVPPAAPIVEPAATAAPVPSPPPAEPAPATAAPLFRARADLGKTSAAPVPPVIPIVRPPDDPGIDEDPVSNEFAEPIKPPQRQAGGWRGFLSRWGG
jgi:HemY protein